MASPVHGSTLLRWSTLLRNEKTAKWEDEKRTMKIGITGGIGSGKSYVCRLLKKRGISVYDCDAAAKRLMRTSPTLRQQLTSLIGPDAYESQETYKTHEPQESPAPYVLNKSAVARFLLQSEENTRAIDAIVHPAVAADFQQSGMLWMECAILFESGFNRLVDRTVAITAPEEVRLQRVMQRDGISHEQAQQWLQRQWPQEEVLRHADYEIINDGIADLNTQLDRLLKDLPQQNP